MFRNAYQSGWLSILYSCGSSPLEIWGTQVKNGYIRRVTDEEVKSLALEIAGTNVSTTFIYTPKNPKTVLAITLPFLIIIIKNMKKYFTFEVTILDDKNMHRRFRISNFQSTTKVRPFCTSMPIGLCDGWNQIQFNLADFTRRAYGSNYMETTRMQIHANCRLRRIYFADRLYSDDDLPEDYKLLFPGRRDTCIREESKIQERPAGQSRARISVEAIPSAEPPAFRGDPERIEEETGIRTTPVLSREASRLVVAPEGASKVQIEIPRSSEDEEEMEPEVDHEYEGEEVTTPEREDTADEASPEEEIGPFSPSEEEQDEEERNVEASENEEELLAMQG